MSDFQTGILSKLLTKVLYSVILVLLDNENSSTAE